MQSSRLRCPEILRMTKDRDVHRLTSLFAPKRNPLGVLVISLDSVRTQIIQKAAWFPLKIGMASNVPILRRQPPSGTAQATPP